jgi:ubiquinone/menaquinone biosynthesis C-methylase UbiE
MILYIGGVMRQMLLRKEIRWTVLTVLLLIFSVVGCTNHQKQHTSENHEPATKQRFKDIDFWVKMFEDPARDEWQKPAEVVKTMKLKPGEVVADIGAGTGYFTRHFAVAVAPGGKALGLDIEQSMVDYMNKDAEKLDLPNYSAKVISTHDPELEKSSVDVIFLCNTYHHIGYRVAYFRNAAKSLKPDGRIVIVDFYKNTDFGPPRDHKLAKEVVLKEMDAAGYRLDKDLKVLEQQYYLEYVVK